jgi:hypothetical protein
MRFIWAIIAGLFLAAGVLLFRSPEATRTSPPANLAPTSDAEVDSPSPVDRISSLASTADVASPEAATATAITTTASTAAAIEPS